MVYMGGLDGYVRKFSTDATTDDSTTFESYIDYGPFGQGHGFRNNCVDMITGSLADDSNPVTWYLRGGASAEQAYNVVPSATTDTRTGTWNTAGYNYRAHPRLSASDFFLRLRNPTQPWAVERLGLIMSNRGINRG
jgi:hypothetical protein